MISVQIALVTALAAVACWSLLTIRVLTRGDRRRQMVVMAIVGTLASIGTLGSALAFGSVHGVSLGVDPYILSLVASTGRGALAMGGLIALRRLSWRPR